MMTWGMLFYHAAVVHVIGFTVLAAAVVVGRDYFLDTLEIDRILTDGPLDFTKKSPMVASSVFGLYFLYLLVGAAVSGIIDLPSKLTNGLGRAANRLNLAPRAVGNEPIWYRALHVDREGEHIQVRIRMKNGDVYVGDLHYYSILPDSAESKERDVRLGNSMLYPAGDESSPIVLEFSEHGGGGVLLNTANISSMEYLFHDASRYEAE